MAQPPSVGCSCCASFYQERVDKADIVNAADMVRCFSRKGVDVADGVDAADEVRCLAEKQSTRRYLCNGARHGRARTKELGVGEFM